MMELIPAIDLKDGRVVRLLKGDFDARTDYDLSPADLYERYATAGARRIHVVDLDGARDGAAGNRAVVAALAARGRLKLQSGGGIRDHASLRSLLEAGVERAVVGSVAVQDPDTVLGWLAEFGADRIVLALDVRVDDGGVPRLAINGWRSQSAVSLWDAVQRFAAAGLAHVLCTDIDRDGALSGPNTTLYREAVERFPGIGWQASGGVASAADLGALAASGVAATVSGKALIEGRIDNEELRPFLPAA